MKQYIKYQAPVSMAAVSSKLPYHSDGRAASTMPPQTTKFLDAWIPETRVLIEHKSRGVNLDAPQAGHVGLTPYEQAVEYDNARPFDEKARWIVTCNFDEFRIYDRTKPLAPPQRLNLGNLPKEAHRLAFLVNPKEKAIDRELEISVQAGRIVGEIYDALLGQYNMSHAKSAKSAKENSNESLRTSRTSREENTVSQEHLAALNRLCVRLVFCLYAEDAEIFPKDCFRRLMEATPAPFLRKRLIDLFQTLDTPTDKRNPYLEPELCAFPYTNGGLFRIGNNIDNGKNNFDLKPGATAPGGSVAAPVGAAEKEEVVSTSCPSCFQNTPDDIPQLTEEIRQLLIGASKFDWRDITPTIFGALFESTLNPETRRAGGMVYTSVENIHKVIDPLFLDDLTRRVDEAVGRDDLIAPKSCGGMGSCRPTVSRESRNALLALQAEMASRKFLDPACGSGNFLTETYICLRRLENRIIAALQQGQGELWLENSGGSSFCSTVKVSLAQFFGLEINDFAVAVAKTALWIAESQMKQETAEILHREPDYLPLKDNANIVECNALRTDWPRTDYIIGNPPFLGARWMGKEQKADVQDIFGKDWQGVGDLDYVCCWYKKAMDSLAAKNAKVAFVSTNSICQGGAVANLWKPLFAQGLEIDFAHRTFRWDSEAFEKAHVHCVIIGFHTDEGESRVERADRAELPLPPQSSTRSTCSTRLKTIFDNGRAIPATHINGYLMDSPDIWIESRTTPICAVPEIGIGNKPIDGGNYLFTKEEMEEF